MSIAAVLRLSSVRVRRVAHAASRSARYPVGVALR